MGDTSSVGYWAVRSVVREGHKELGAATMANNEDSDVKMIEDKTNVSLDFIDACDNIFHRDQVDGYKSPVRTS